MHRIFIFCLMVLFASCNEAPRDNQASSPGTGARSVAGDSTGTTGDGVVSIWADPLLAAPLEALGQKLKADHGINLSVEVADRQQFMALVADPSLELPDVVMFAGTDIAEALREAELIEVDSLRTFAGDRLAVVQKRGNIYRVSSLYETYKLFFDHFGVGEQGTTAGFFGNQALVTSGAKKRLDLDSKITELPATAAILTALEEESVELAIVAASTAAQTPAIEICKLIDETHHEDIQYLVAATTGNASAMKVMDLLRLLAEDPDTQQTLVGYGLLDRETALDETP